jgi:hypothetical protein
MALSTYAELQASIAGWAHRTDLTAMIPDFIRMAEVKMTEDLNSREMETTSTLTTTTGSAYVTLPIDFKLVKRLVLVDDPNRVLKYAAPEVLTEDYPNSGTDESILYTIIGSQLQLAPIPDSNYDLSLTYERTIPALSDSNTTNWLLTRSPNAYLFGSLMMAAPYCRDDPRIAVWQQFYLDAINGINLTDWHNGASMRIRAR